MKRRFFLGEWREAGHPLSKQEALELCELSHQRRKELDAYPLDKILNVLQQLGDLWSDPEFSLRKECEKELPQITGFSREMIQRGLSSVGVLLQRQGLEQKLKKELRGVIRGTWNTEIATGTRVYFQPLGVILHILSGNVFMVGLSSLIEGVITGNVTLLKQSSEEQFFLPCLIESLQSIDREGILTRSIGLFDYSSQDHEVIKIFKKSVDGLVVWGGEEAVRAYRNDLPARTKLIIYGPKLSFSLVTDQGIKENKLDVLATQAASELAVWDQSACTAPQVMFVEKDENAEVMGNALASALQKISADLPSGAAATDTAIDIQKIRMVGEVGQARGENHLWISKNNVDWTIYTSRNKALEPSPLHRTLKLVAFQRYEDVIDEMEAMRGYIQTVGLGVGRAEYAVLASKLTRAGALRILELGQMGSGEVDDPHDGAFDLSQFGSFVIQRDQKKPLFWEERLDDGARLKVIEQKLRTVVETARASQFYGARLKNVEIESLNDLQKIPPLSRREMEEQAQPSVSGLQTRKWSGGYVTRSGGSTGVPKFSVYDGRDWEALVVNAVKVLMGAGLKPGDRVANCMLAGDLYGSFVSFDHINCRLGATSFAFAGELKTDVFLQTWKDFKINAIEAIPTVLMPLLRACKSKESSFQIETIIYGGQPLSPTDREWIRVNCGTQRISSIIGANDGGQIGFQCEFCDGAIHHVIDDYNFIEIVDEKGEPVSEGEVGKILITSLEKLAFPLLRYEIGDSARFVSEACLCGRQGRRIEYLGRTDDMLSVGLMNVNYQDIQLALRDLPISLVQLVAFSHPQGESIRLNIETEEFSSDFLGKVRSKLFAGIPKLKEQKEKQVLFDVEIVIKKPGELPRDPRTGKVRLVIDERL